MNKQIHVRFDWAVKHLLRDKANFGILEGFLSELLKEDITIKNILESKSNEDSYGAKFNRVYLLVENQKGELVIIEIQNSHEADYLSRILFSVPKTIMEHIKLGENYSKIKKIISVNIIYFGLGKDEDYVYKETISFTGLLTDNGLEFTNVYITHILTDNGLEFTNRLLKFKKGESCKTPSKFDVVCAKNNIDHRCTKPFTPKTNGMVEKPNT